jgi:hypothetical protein
MVAQKINKIEGNISISSDENIIYEEFIKENGINKEKISENGTLSPEKLTYVEKLFSLPKISYNSINNKFWSFFGYNNNEAINAFVDGTNIKNLNSTKMDTNNIQILPKNNNELAEYNYNQNDIKTALSGKYKSLNYFKTITKPGHPIMYTKEIDELKSDITHLKNLSKTLELLDKNAGGSFASIYNGKNVTYKNNNGETVKFDYELINAETVSHSDITLNGNYNEINSEQKAEALSEVQSDVTDYYMSDGDQASTEIVTLIQTADNRYYSTSPTTDGEVIYCNIIGCERPLVANVVKVNTNDIGSVLELFNKTGVPNILK